jgi:predicted dehydrogenase
VDENASSRREFIKTSAGVAAGASLLHLAGNVHAAGSDVLKVGLIGCGGRGTGAAEQACNAGDDVRLVALGDMFQDRISEKSAILKDSLGNKYLVKDDHCFTGFDAYKGVIDSDVDVVLLATPPHFRPQHLAYAVEKGKHCFVEKPVAVDGPGCKSVLETCEKARSKKLAIVSGLCWRYDDGMRATFKRIHEGGLGDIVAMQCSYNTGSLWHRSLKEKEQKGWSDMEWQIRNWLYFTWLSGDHNVEQHVHSLDKMAWAMKNEYPVKCVGMGGRQVRTAPDFGNIFDHHAVVYEFANGVKAFSFCRQQAHCANEVNDFIMGTKGTCDVMAHKITGVEPWQFNKQSKKRRDMYQNEHNELFASIRSGNPINDGDWMTKSTVMAVMGRMATYTGQVVTFDKALNSPERLGPEKYEMGPIATPEVARPGYTKLV